MIYAAYTYDNNGNMITRGSQTLTWDVENRPISVNTSPATSFVYDGDGKRVKKTEGGQTTVYVNKYYEKNLTTGDITLYYYLGDKMVALKKAGTLRYVSQDHLTGTSLTSDTGGNLVATIKFFPFGATRAATGTTETEKKFTGQRLDAGTGLYYYGARYYDANIGRFISADSIVPSLRNPQSLNRYSYALNNPLRYLDPSGHDPETPEWALVQDSNTGTVSWANGSDIQAAQQAGASIVQPWDVPEGIYGLWSPSTSVGGGGNGENGGVTPTTQNPDIIIANGASTAPALPGGPPVGVGSTGSQPGQAANAIPHGPITEVGQVESGQEGPTQVQQALQVAGNVVFGATLIFVGVGFMAGGVALIAFTAVETGPGVAFAIVPAVGMMLTGYAATGEGIRRVSLGNLTLPKLPSIRLRP